MHKIGRLVIRVVISFTLILKRTNHYIILMKYLKPTWATGSFNFSTALEMHSPSRFRGYSAL